MPPVHRLRLQFPRKSGPGGESFVRVEPSEGGSHRDPCRHHPPTTGRYTCRSASFGKTPSCARRRAHAPSSRHLGLRPGLGGASRVPRCLAAEPRRSQPDARRSWHVPVLICGSKSPVVVMDRRVRDGAMRDGHRRVDHLDMDIYLRLCWRAAADSNANLRIRRSQVRRRSPLDGRRRGRPPIRCCYRN